jgi:hypothetical protein
MLDKKLKKELLLVKKAQALAKAKTLIANAIVKNVGSVTSQLNASTATDPEIQKEWRSKFKIRDEIKFTHGRRLKDSIRNAKNLDDLEKISMNEKHEDWANGE